ncbi:DEAD/DEAH box helicase [Neorhodopirellula pilleata]|uniref:ATP-dependent RNA helicase DeaD n=1 Tax=Neorhodopirellula pilleata TaxID=2714738 RepID=A0A5C5ZYZ6_9BACT|nr:DEAD/DEAH box helicase [Neorhodopirellula pilleata]TWT92499.1 ATP-dependent RNA helicase DeaD [Neorhodopirellula pilleata]
MSTSFEPTEQNENATDASSFFEEAMSVAAEQGPSPDALLASYFQDNTLECIPSPAEEVNALLAITDESAPIESPVSEEVSSLLMKPEKKKKKKKRLAEEQAAAELAARLLAEATAQAEPQKPSNRPEPMANDPIGVAVESETEMNDDPGFSAIGLRPEVLQAVLNSGYATPTAIQAEIIPHMLAGRDVLAQSQTGTGKTAAFALPILSTIDMHVREPQVLVLAPTRELAIQVARSFSTYGANLERFEVVAIYGGQDYEPQLRQLRRGVQIVVGTPGRVIDHVNRGTLDLSRLKCLVLDEADEMLNMGFLEDVQFVLEKTPDDRQVALFSATLPGPIRDIADEYLRDPARITIKKKTATADSIRQRALFVPPKEKIDALVRLLEVEETDGVIVFTKTKDATISVAESLVREGLSAVALNGDMPQKVRERTISQLKSGKLDILVATDVAARGLDVPRISHVFNYDLPHDSESYIHRVGRTGRAGRNGEAIIFLTNAQRSKLRLIERTTKQPIEIIDVPTAKQINAMRVKRFTQKITDVSAEKDLTLFKEMITEYAAETGKPLEMIAAALAEIAQQGRPFLMKDRPAGKRPQDFDRREDSYDRSERGDRYGDRKEKDRGGDAGRPPRQLGPPEAGMVRYRIDVGWNDGVKPGNIVGAVANEAGIEGQYIGPISIRNEFSTIDLPEGMPEDIYQKLRKTWVSGKRLNLEVSRGDEEQTERRGGRPHSGGGSSFKPRPGKGQQGKRPFNGKKKRKNF